MGTDFPIGECAVCVTLWNAEQPKRIIVQPASVIAGGTGVCRRHLRHVRVDAELRQAADSARAVR
jgi:hypothetical protein